MKRQKYVPLHFDSHNRVAVLAQISTEAQKFFNETIPAGEKLKISVEIDHNGDVQVFKEESTWGHIARAAGIQMRLNLLVGGYHVRIVDFSKLHQVNTEDLDRMVDALSLANGNIALDMMCGYGSLTERILEVSKKNEISIELYCADLYLEQLERIKESVKKQICDIRITDARCTSYPDNFFDAIAIKMGIHDVPRSDQGLIFDEAFRILKPGGRLVIWEVLTDRSEEQDAFSAQINKKDELAGYESFIIDRYFLRSDQVIALYKNSGFIEVEEVFSAHFSESSKSRLDSELHHDPHKLEELNQYIRKCTPENIRASMHYQDNGESISMTIPNRVFRAIKSVH
ncbi:MAG: methyltransferase domain-containing protein [Chlamydiales bacterium]|nr:methyltransferase domain-containing protein [Chlamydiales bacterium]